MHVVIYQKDSDTIKYVVFNCIRKGNLFVGDGKKIQINPNFYDVMWTDDVINPIMDGSEIIGWDKSVSELTPSADVMEIVPPGKANLITAMKIRKLIDNLTYQELETYIENNIIDLITAKEFLKTLSKVILALCKIVDSK